MSSNSPLAIVTGASSGIGEKLAERLAQRGFRTALIARRRDRLDSLAQRIKGHAYPTDLADEDAVAAVSKQIKTEHGDAQVLINNAGYGAYRAFLNTSLDEHNRLMQVNFTAAAALIHAVLPGMVRRGSGHVINIASVAATMGPWGHGVYAASKAAIRALTQSLAGEYRGQGVDFSCVLPGLVLTEFFDDPSYTELFGRHRHRAITADKAADRIVRLLDRPRLELTVPARMRVLDLIAAVSPCLAHRLVTMTSRPKPTAAPAAAHPDGADKASASAGP